MLLEQVSHTLAADRSRGGAHLRPITIRALVDQLPAFNVPLFRILYGLAQRAGKAENGQVMPAAKLTAGAAGAIVRRLVVRPPEAADAVGRP
jgi:hypothetical protein